MKGEIVSIMREYWGYDSFLPLQQEAMESAVGGRDSIVILPTGGGKSLCYQAPALVREGMAVVVSPLISLMKDQVDALIECGVAAGRIDSSQSSIEQRATFDGIRDGQIKLLYLSPERLFSNGFIGFLRQHNLSFIAIDEAHCVSMWGHDFRPEYRQLGQLKKDIPGIGIHAYTATATEPVRQDIARQLVLEKPRMLVGSFDRPNLIYKVERRGDVFGQVCEVLDRHRGESGIVYCIRRRDVEEMCVRLRQAGYKAAPYHAGMETAARQKNQDDFTGERIDIIVATIAFGMGIDKSNIRYVIHTGMPKSLEHYQQESGRAGRDGLEAECCLFFGGGDFGLWKSILRDLPEGFKEISIDKVGEMYNYCTGTTCRHDGLLQYFGQRLGKENCGACDICLGGFDTLADALVVAQKILSCIVRLQERFGGDYTASVLIGSRDKRILENEHNTLSTYGLLSDYTKRIVRDWIEQLSGQNYIAKTGEYNVISVTEKGWLVLKGTETPRLLKPSEKKPVKSKAEIDSWKDVDRGLFEALRAHRSMIAHNKGVPAFVVFGDASLRDMARRRPSSLSNFLGIHGVGQKKSRDYGKEFIHVIRQYCKTHALGMDVASSYNESAIKSRFTIGEKPKMINQSKQQAFNLFRKKMPIAEIAGRVGRVESTVVQYLEEYIELEGIECAEPWVDKETAARITEAAEG
ncbi:MAG: DNA helicase RecQ, partial [Planctomycetes bacterium]|nr:DNA helicase RecQ [Planctomycetota bacterium]